MMDEALILERVADPERLQTAMQTPTINPAIEFHNGQFLFRKVNLEGGVIERYVSHAAVKEAFSGLPIDSGWFNLELACPGICRWGNGRLGEWAVAFIPPARHELEITNDGTNKPFAVEKLKTPLPGMVFFGISNQYFTWAVKTERLLPFHELYRCPLPNVMQDGSICWGLLKPPFAKASTIFDAFKLFMTSTFNNHMANAKSKRMRDDVRVVLKDMSRAPLPSYYPVADLMRQVDVTGVTLDQAIRGFFETGKMPG
jgi:hypothetical protein